MPRNLRPNPVQQRRRGVAYLLILPQLVHLVLDATGGDHHHLQIAPDLVTWFL